MKPYNKSSLCKIWRVLRVVSEGEHSARGQSEAEFSLGANVNACDFITQEYQTVLSYDTIESNGKGKIVTGFQLTYSVGISTH